MAVIKNNGGYNALPISYKRTNPIPLDKSAVWYDYDQMAAYAKNNVTAYVGQILSLVETESLTAKAYIILNTQGDLEALGSATLISDVDDIKLQLETIDESLEILLNRIGVPAEGENSASGLFAEVDKKANIADVYTKEETNIYVGEAIAAASHLKRKEVPSTEDIDINAPDADEYVYMVPSGLKDDDNKYYEYMVMDIEIGSDEDGNPILERRIELVGSWSVDLSDYATKADLNNEITRATIAESALNDKINELETNVETLNSDLENIKSDISILEETKVNQIYYPVTDENGEVTQVPGTLLSPSDKQKLEKLSINDDGDLGISGTVNASNVQGLDIWMAEESAKYIQNLTEENLSETLKNKINFITTVDSSSFTVENGKLILNEIPVDKVTGLAGLVTKVGNLEEALNLIKGDIENEETGLIAVNKKIIALSESLNDYVTVIEFNKTVGSLEESLNSIKNDINHEETGLVAINKKVIALSESLNDYVTVIDFNNSVGNLDSLLASNTTLVQEVEEIKSRLVWKDL